MIYALQNESMQIKIGFTRDARTAERRVLTLRTASAAKLKLLFTAEGDWRDEHALHKLLRQFRVNGEWFSSEEWMDPLMDNVLAVLPALGAKVVLGHDEDALRNFNAFPVLRGFELHPGKWKGIRIADLR